MTSQEKLHGMQQRAIKIGKANRTHGESYATGNTAEYKIWTGMLRRCFNPNEKPYPRYGGRGITVCKRWLQYENFLADMGRRPSPNHTLERKNNDGNYEPDNCCWLPAKMQARNRRSNHLITHEGKTLCLAEWAELKGVNYKLLHQRINRDGLSFERALTIADLRKPNSIEKESLNV